MAIKLSVNLAADVIDALEELAKKRGTTKTDVIRHAISLDKFVQDEIDAGGKLLIEDRNNDVRQVLLI